MSVWVAPAVAAELWGCSIDQVLAAVRDGHVASRIDGQFLLVQMQFPGMAIAAPPTPAPQRPRVPEEILTPEEIAALKRVPLIEDPPKLVTEEPPIEYQPAAEVSDESDEDLELEEASVEPQRDISDWRKVRRQTATLRRPPMRAA
jgi:hypothetical protein